MITEVIHRDLVAKTKTLIEDAEHIVIVTHINPDGDALGSSLGMMHFLTEWGKEDVQLILPSRYPTFLEWLPGCSDTLIYDEQQAKSDLIISKADLIIGIDFNGLKRIGKMEDIVKGAAAKKLLLDHHPNPESFANTIISYPEISSASEIVFRLICRMGYFQNISLICAECIYTGMMTDTGNFSYNSNNAEIYTIIAQLLKIGINKDVIYQKVYDNYSYNRMRFMGYCLYNKMKIYPEYHTALIYISGKELFQFNYQNGDAEGFVNMPLSIDGIYFSVFMREDKEKIKISLRSQGNFSCNIVAKDLFNGGGHFNASGGESYASLEETIALFEKALPTYFQSPA